MSQIDFAGPLNTRRRQALVLSSASVSSTLVNFSSNVDAQQSKYGILGQKAPELDIDYWIDGLGIATEFSVAEQQGKWVFLKFFQNWCPGCHSSGFPTLQKFSAEFQKHPLVAIAAIQTVFEGYSSNTKEAVRKLQLRYELPVIMGHDAGDPSGNRSPKTMIRYRSGGTPWLVLINPEGTVVYNDFHVNTEKLIEFVKDQIT